MELFLVFKSSSMSVNDHVLLDFRCSICCLNRFVLLSETTCEGGVYREASQPFW